MQEVNRLTVVQPIDELPTGQSGIIDNPQDLFVVSLTSPVSMALQEGTAAAVPRSVVL
jgi:hypothetical protein